MVAQEIANIEQIADVDARILRAAALLERKLKQRSPHLSGTLGERVQNEQSFCSFIRDLNFALGVRNKIAHGDSDDEANCEEEKSRAARYLIHAIEVLDGLNPDTPPPSQKPPIKEIKTADQVSGGAQPALNLADQLPNIAAIVRANRTRRRRVQPAPAPPAHVAAQNPFADALKALVGLLSFLASAGAAIILAWMLLKSANEIARPELLDPTSKSGPTDRTNLRDWSSYQTSPSRGHVPIPNSSGTPSGLGAERDDYGREGGYPSYPVPNSGIRQTGPY